MAANAAPSTLAEERRKATFSSDQLTTLLAGGEAHLRLKNIIEDQISRDAVSNCIERTCVESTTLLQDFQSALVKHGASREVERESSARLVTKLIKYLRADGDDDETRHTRESCHAPASAQPLHKF